MATYTKYTFFGLAIIISGGLVTQRSGMTTVGNQVFDSQKSSTGISSKQGAEPPLSHQQNQAVMGWKYLVVRHSQESAPEMLASYETVAEILSESAEKSQYLPQERLNHFSWITPEIAPPIIGWNGDIREMRETPKGLLVTLNVTAKFPGNFIAGAYTTETFLVNGTKVQPVGLEKSPADLPKVITDP